MLYKKKEKKKGLKFIELLLLSSLQLATFASLLYLLKDLPDQTQSTHFANVLSSLYSFPFLPDRFTCQREFYTNSDTCLHASLPLQIIPPSPPYLLLIFLVIILQYIVVAEKPLEKNVHGFVYQDKYLHDMCFWNNWVLPNKYKFK